MNNSISDRLQRYMDAVRAGILTPNEVRKLENLRPYPGGDHLYVDGSYKVISPSGAPVGNAYGAVCIASPYLTASHANGTLAAQVTSMSSAVASANATVRQ